MSDDPCTPPSAHNAAPARTHHHVAHHGIGRHAHRLHRVNRIGSAQSHPAVECGKHFEAGRPGVLAARPIDAAPLMTTSKAAVIAAVGGGGVASLLGGVALASALGLPVSFSKEPVQQQSPSADVAPASAVATPGFPAPLTTGPGVLAPLTTAPGIPGPSPVVGGQAPHLSPASPSPGLAPAPTPIPEPSSTALLGGGICLALVIQLSLRMFRFRSSAPQLK